MLFAKQNLAWQMSAAGRSGFESRQWQQIFRCSKTPDLSLRPNQRLIRWVPGFFSGRKATASRFWSPLSSNAEGKYEWGHTSIPLYAFMALTGLYLTYLQCWLIKDSF